MHTLDLYLARSVAISISMVLLVLLSLFVFVDFVTELDEVGKGNYDITEAAQYVILIIPRRVVELTPVACLLGTTLGLGMLANSSELTAIRAAGISMLRIAWSLIKMGIVIVILLRAISDYIAPASEQWGQNIRAAAIAQTDTILTRQGFWTRNGNDFVRAKTVLASSLMSGVEVYQVNGTKLTNSLKADFAVYQNNNHWLLQNVRISIFTEKGVDQQSMAQLIWQSDLQPELLDIFTIRPDRLSIDELNDYVNYLNANGQDALDYEVAYWKKTALPVTIMVMICVAIPFVFGPMRSVSIGQRIVVGALVGISFHVFDQTMGHLGVVYRLNPLLTAYLPTLIFIGLTIWLMRTTR